MKSRIELLLVILLAGVFLTACRQTSSQKDNGSLSPKKHLIPLHTEISAMAVNEASPFFEIANEPEPRLIVDSPLADGLARGIFWAQYRVENIRILPVFGPGSLKVSPRIGHLHITVDDLPWWWPEASGNNTIDIAGFPPGPHKVKISLMNSNHVVFPGQSRTLSFTIPERASASHSH